MGGRGTPGQQRGHHRYRKRPRVPGSPGSGRARRLRHGGVHAGQRALPAVPHARTSRRAVRAGRRGGCGRAVMAHLRRPHRDHGQRQEPGGGLHRRERVGGPGEERAWGVPSGLYTGLGAQTARAPAEAASAPAAIASSVLAISGLDTGKSEIKPADTLPPPGPNYWVAPPCSTYYAQKIATTEPAAYGVHQPWTNCGYTPSQIRGAYGVSASGATGKGQAVAIVDAYASPTRMV